MFLSKFCSCFKISAVDQNEINRKRVEMLPEYKKNLHLYYQNKESEIKKFNS
tara:strand:- start:715 stop:870 length:156 start_codon:yes stop_codon:yes gene_type:complete